MATRGRYFGVLTNDQIILRVYDALREVSGVGQGWDKSPLLFKEILLIIIIVIAIEFETTEM